MHIAFEDSVGAIEDTHKIPEVSDAEDGDLSTAIMWASDLDGTLGIGVNINTVLSVG